MIEEILKKYSSSELMKRMQFRRLTDTITCMEYTHPADPEKPLLLGTVVMPFHGMGIFYYGIPVKIDMRFDTLLNIGLAMNQLRFFKLNYCLGGRVEVYLSNKEKYAYLDPGMVAFDQNDPSVTLSFTKQQYQGFGIYFNFDLMSKQDREVLSYYGITHESSMALIERDKACFLGNASSEFTDIIQDLKTRIDDRSLGLLHARMQCTRLVYLLLNDDVRPLETVEYATKGQRKLAEDARELILRDPSLHLTAEDIAEQLSCTAPTLKKYFRKVYGIPMYSFLQDVRMKTAEEALSGSKKSIAQIAEESGYSNTSKFCALFKKTYGVSPMEYRRLHS